MVDLLQSAIHGRAVRNSHAFVVDEIGRAIVTGRYPVGVALPNDAQLTEQFGVSRTVLREAMKTLTAKGLVSPRARVGTRVNDRTAWNMFDAHVLAWHLETGVSPELLGHLTEMRLAFEPHAAGLAARRATPDDTRRLSAHAERMASATTNETFAVADLDFHTTLLAIARNPFLYSVGNLIEVALATSFKLSSPAEDDTLRSAVAGAHQDIAAAVAAGDDVAAADRTRRVIVMGQERIEQAYRTYRV